MQETSAPLKLTVKVTVPIVCNVSNDCRIVLQTTQDNSEIYLSLCSFELTNEIVSQTFEIAVKRDFLHDTNKQTIVGLQIEKWTDPVDFINHHKIPDIMVSKS